MAYPTNVNFKGTGTTIGGQAPNASSTTATAVPGTVSRGVDAIKGEAEFIYLAGVANALLAVSATAGQATVSGGAGAKIDNAVCKTTQDAPGAGFTGVLIMYPSCNGNT
jgi:hypothetical protein